VNIPAALLASATSYTVVVAVNGVASSGDDVRCSRLRHFCNAESSWRPGF
jgi:hypothetical protein